LEYEEYHLQDWPKSPDRDSLVKFNIRNGGYRDVLRTLAPALHIPFIFPADSTLKEWYLGGLVIGADATDENIYAALIAYNPTPKTPFFNISWQSMFTRPMTATLFYRYSNSFNLELNYPLLQSSTPGLSNLSVSLGLSSFDRFKRKEATPSLSFGFRYPSRNFRGYFSFPLERDFWYSSLDRDAQVLKTIFRQELYKGEFRIVVSAYNDPENPDTGSISLRGYEPIKGGRGAFLSTEYSHQVLTIRRGLWNPNIYLEDLFITVFSDVGLIDKKELAYSLGVEIKLETKIGFGWINLSPQFGIALTREKKLKPFWSITAPIL
jgi:hypothetical protein